MALAASSPLILLGLFVDHAAAAWLATVLIALQPALLIAVGAGREGRLGPLAAAVSALIGILAITSLLLLWLSARETSPLAAGFPASFLVALGGFWLLPLILTSVAYVATFERFSLREEDLDTIRRIRDQRRSERQRLEKNGPTES